MDSDLEEARRGWDSFSGANEAIAFFHMQHLGESRSKNVLTVGNATTVSSKPKNSNPAELQSIDRAVLCID